MLFNADVTALTLQGCYVSHLHAGALGGHFLEEGVLRVAQSGLPVGAVESSVVAVAEAADAEVGHRGLEHQQLPAHVRHRHVRRLSTTTNTLQWVDR
eukprot:5302961-Pyramimonas_sp.AAC.1